MGVLMVILTVGGVIAAGVLMAIAICTNKLWLAKFTFGVAALWILFYAAALIGSSLTSTDKTLEVGDGVGKAFCGFYIDCHLHAAVDGVRAVKTIGDRTAHGQFYVVKMSIYSDAKNPSIAFRLLEPRVKVIDGHGNAYARDEAAERSLHDRRRQSRSGHSRAGDDRERDRIRSAR